MQLELEVEGVKRQLLDAAELQQQAASRADSAEGRIKVGKQTAWLLTYTILSTLHLAFTFATCHKRILFQDLEAKLQDESSLLKSLQRANLEAAAAAQQQSALKQHVIQ